jgi:general secretion pathway protein L
VVKAITLPAVTGADRRRMVGFELGRHLPFPAADAVFDFETLDETPGRPVRVLLVAAERRVFDQAADLARALRAPLRLLDVTVHGLARASPDAEPREGSLVGWLGPEEAELAVVRAGRLWASRAAPLPADGPERGEVLARELRRTLAGLPADERDAVTSVALGGERIPAVAAADLPPCEELPSPRGLPEVAPRFRPALVLAARRGVDRGAGGNLVPAALRPSPFRWAAATTAGLLLLAVALGAAIPAAVAIRDERALAALDREVAQLAPDIRRVERLAAEVEQARRELQTLRGFELGAVHPLPVLRELTELLPADVWLTALTVDRTGVELAGFAGSASPLIALLEASPRFDRVEFTSPVTKGRDREQFRLRAAWERPAR